MTVRELIERLMRDADLDDTVHGYEGEKTGICVDRFDPRARSGWAQVAFYDTEEKPRGA